MFSPLIGYFFRPEAGLKSKLNEASNPPRKRPRACSPPLSRTQAEAGGFEPPIPFRVCRFSKPVISTAHPRLLIYNQTFIAKIYHLFAIFTKNAMLFLYLREKFVNCFFGLNQSVAD